MLNREIIQDAKPKAWSLKRKKKEAPRPQSDYQQIISRTENTPSVFAQETTSMMLKTFRRLDQSKNLPTINQEIANNNQDKVCGDNNITIQHEKMIISAGFASSTKTVSMISANLRMNAFAIGTTIATNPFSKFQKKRKDRDENDEALVSKYQKTL